MKTKHCSILLFLLILAFPSVADARQKEGLTKVTRREFPVTPATKLKVINSFGDVTCTLWDQSSIVIEVTVSVDTRSEQEGDNVFSKVDIAFSESNGLVEVKTNLAKTMKARDHFSIDYVILMPGSVPLDVSNRFGDVMIDELQAKSAIRVDYGKAALGTLAHGDNLLEISFGSASVKSVKGLVASVRFSKMRVDYAGSLKIKSTYTDLQVGEVVVLDGSFEGGSMEFERTSVLAIESRYSAFKIGLVKQKISLGMQFGSLDVAGVSPAFKSLVIDCTHGSVTCPLPEELSYSLDAESHFGSIRFPDSRATFSVFNDTGESALYRGTIGTNPTATVKIKNEFGSIKL